MGSGPKVPRLPPLPTRSTALLVEGLSIGELRALRLLVGSENSCTDVSYLAHVRHLARAMGPGAGLARTVKRADLADRITNPQIRPDGWSPP